MPPLKTPTPTCPRCGYDQSGAVTTWTDACPCAGLCPECGLAFNWTDLFNADRDRVRGFVEHARGRRQLARATPLTAWLAIRPWVFWQRIQMHMASRPSRALLWLLLLTVGLWVARGLVDSTFVLIESGLAGTAYQRGVSRGTPLWVYLLSEWVQSFAAVFHSPNTGFVWTWTSISSLTYEPSKLMAVSTLVWPVLFVLLPHTRRSAKVQPRHIWRAFVYSWAWLLVLDLTWVFGRLHRLYIDIYIGMGLKSGRLPHTWAGNIANWLWDWNRAGPWFIIPVWLWLWLWWFMAIKRGLKLPHAAAVAVSLGAINAIITALLWASIWIARVN